MSDHEHARDRDNSESTFVLWKHTAARTPRMLHSHEHIDTMKCDAISSSYPACAMVNAKDVEKETPQEQKAFIEAREKATEKWLDEMADCINIQHRVPAQLAFHTFAPTSAEPLSAIFLKYSGAPQ